MVQDRMNRRKKRHMSFRVVRMKCTTPKGKTPSKGLIIHYKQSLK